jgi:hypothetical protein
VKENAQLSLVTLTKALEMVPERRLLWSVSSSRFWMCASTSGTVPERAAFESRSVRSALSSPRSTGSVPEMAVASR